MGHLSLRALALSLVLVAALALPAAAGALSFEVDNQSGVDPGEVFVTAVTNQESQFKFKNDELAWNTPKPLQEIESEFGGKLEIEEMVAGRIYISYGAGITEQTAVFTSPTRFDWIELNVPDGVVNLTAVDQFGIGMRLETLGEGGEVRDTLGSANSDTIFDALQDVPGGPGATVRDGLGRPLRVKAPKLSSSYPDLGDYVRSMAGQHVDLRTAFYGTKPISLSHYSGTFEADGSITLEGTSEGAEGSEPKYSYSGEEIIHDVYTGENTPNNFKGTIYRDLLAGFSLGLWDGKYGNDARDWCTDFQTVGSYGFCTDGFNQPAFGDAKTSLQPFATCDQYAAVINQYGDVYGNPYSDAAKQVQIPLEEPDVKTLKLTLQPDSGDAQPVQGGNPDCGAASPVSPSPPPPPAPAPARAATPKVAVRFFAKAKRRGRLIKVGRLVCSVPCGKTRALAKHGKVLARAKRVVKQRQAPLKLKLTKKGLRKLKRAGHLKARVTVWVKPAGSKTQRRVHTVKLVR